jgi:hypothetical protein
MERNEIRDGAVGQDRPAFRFAACGLYILSLPFDLKMNVVVVTRRPAALEADERRRHPQARCKVGLGEDALQPEILPFVTSQSRRARAPGLERTLSFQTTAN